MIVSFLSKFRSRSNDLKLPHYLLKHPRNGGGPEQVLLSVERRLRRLHKFTKHDPIELLDDVDQEGLTLRQRIRDPAQPWVSEHCAPWLPSPRPNGHLT